MLFRSLPASGDVVSTAFALATVLTDLRPPVDGWVAESQRAVEGAGFTYDNPEPRVPELVLEGRGRGAIRPATGAIDCGNAGTAMRLLAGVLASAEGTFRLTGDASLQRRPMERVAVPLRRMGADVTTADGHAPIVIRGGENVLPGPIEQALLRHPAVAEVVVTGTPHRDLGQAVAATVVRRGQVAASDLAAWLAPLLPASHVPTAWFTAPELPKSALGKVLRANIQRRLKIAMALECGAEGFRHLAGSEAVQIDEGVDMANTGAHGAVAALHLKSKGHGAGADFSNLDPDHQSIAEPHRRAVVGLGVHQRHAPAFELEHRVELQGALVQRGRHRGGLAMGAEIGRAHV